MRGETERVDRELLFGCRFHSSCSYKVFSFVEKRYFLYSRKVFFGQKWYVSGQQSFLFFGRKGDSPGRRKYFLAEKVVFWPRNVFLHPLVISDTIILKMISSNSRDFLKNFSTIWHKKILHTSIKNFRYKKNKTPKILTKDFEIQKKIFE